MRTKIIFPLLLLLAFICGCQKSPTHSQLIGTWTEINDETEKSKLIFFEGDSLYFFHNPDIDTLSFILDEKHNTLYLTFIHHPATGASTVTCTYHKRKKILTLTGLFPPKNGNQQVTTNYRQ